MLVPIVDWRAALALGGIGLGALTVLAVFAIPRAAGAPGPRPAGPRPLLPAALRFRGVWAIGLAFVGFEGATFAASQFIVPFGEVIRGWSGVIAGTVGMMFVLPSVVGGPVGGRSRSDTRTTGPSSRS